MSVLYQRNRVYSLIVGTQENAVEISNLQIRFQVTKTSSNKDKKNQARVDIYNLSEEHQALLEDKYVTVQLKVAYADRIGSDDDLITLFTGQVVEAKMSEEGSYRTSRQRTDLVTSLVVDELFKELNGRQVSKTIPAGKKVRDVILGVVEDVPEITRYEINGEGVEREVPDGYPICGTPRQVFDELSKTYGIECQIDNTVLYVADSEGTFSDNTEGVPLIGEFSGLIERPEFRTQDVKKIKTTSTEGKAKGKADSKNTQPKENTIHLKVLLNPTITAGSIVKIEWGDINGYYKVNEVTHEGDFRGDDWYSKLILSAKEVA